jgi:hypothetical protein
MKSVEEGKLPRLPFKSDPVQDDRMFGLPFTKGFAGGYSYTFDLTVNR